MVSDEPASSVKRRPAVMLRTRPPPEQWRCGFFSARGMTDIERACPIRACAQLGEGPAMWLLHRLHFCAAPGAYLKREMGTDRGGDGLAVRASEVGRVPAACVDAEPRADGRGQSRPALDGACAERRSDGGAAVEQRRVEPVGDVEVIEIEIRLEDTGARSPMAFQTNADTRSLAVVEMKIERRKIIGRGIDRPRAAKRAGLRARSANGRLRRNGAPASPDNVTPRDFMVMKESASESALVDTNEPMATKSLYQPPAPMCVQ